MTAPWAEQVAWEDANNQYLSASLSWLRLLLMRYAAERPNIDHAGPGVAWQRSADVPTIAEVEAAADAVAVAAATSPPPALVRLATDLGLSPFEQHTLLLCAAMELDPRVGDLCAAAHGNDRMSYPTFGLALSLFPDPAWHVVSPQRGLRYWRLVEISQPASRSLVTSALRADERIVNYIKGLSYLDERMEAVVGRIEADAGVELPESQRAVVDEITRHWRTPSGAEPIVQLAGADVNSKQLLAAVAAAECGLTAFRLPSALLPTQLAELDSLARLWQREALLLPVALYLDVDDQSNVDESRPVIGRFLHRLRGPTFFATRESWPDLGRQSVVLDVASPDATERAVAWHAALGPDAVADTVRLLAGQFALDVPAIRTIAAMVGDDPADLWRACRARTRPRLDALAQRLTPTVTWDDIVLPDEGLTLLRQVADQVAHRATVYEDWGFGERITRGLGVSSLFVGPSGTGKTMAAEVLANHLRLDLYRIDLSAVISKYIGDTEKNLRRLFDAADGGGAILFFDEADALFGKRTQVKDSHDRYANIEINYLLQRMESYQGLAILATNMRTAMDTAFLRRLRFIVEFAFPDQSHRRAIWEKAFPARAPRNGLDFDRLAQLQVNGGMTRNIALNAAFLAASTGSEITMPIVLSAARTEFRKLRLPIRERDFAWHEVSR